MVYMYMASVFAIFTKEDDFLFAPVDNTVLAGSAFRGKYAHMGVKTVCSKDNSLFKELIPIKKGDNKEKDRFSSLEIVPLIT